MRREMSQESRERPAQAPAGADAMPEWSRERLAAILDSVSDGITVQDATGRLLYANEAAAQAMGYPSVAALLALPAGAAVGRYTVVDEAGQPFPLDQLPGRRALRREPVAELVLGFQQAGVGELRWARVKANPVLDAAGQTQLAITVFQDITARRQAEQAQRILMDAARAFAEASLDLPEVLNLAARQVVAALGDTCVIRLLSTDGLWLEPAAFYHPDPEARAFGDAMMRAAPERSTEGLNGQVVQTGEPVFLPVVDQAQFVAAIKPEYHAYHARFGTYSVLIVPLRVRGRILGVLSIARETPGRPNTLADQALVQELADRAAVAIENARLYQEAQAAVRARDQFLSIAAHELRTPLASIHGYIQLLRRAQARGQVDADRLARYLPTLDSLANRLGGLVDDLLDVSRLRLGQLPFRPRTLDLGALVRTVAARDDEQALAEQPLLLDLPPGACWVNADADRLEQVLANLLSNARKYSPAGGAIRVALRPDGAGVLLCVQDSGIGLPPGSAEVIFTPFGRAPNALARQLPGLGLGLYLCREIVAQHGGRIWAESAGEDQGTTVSVWLPAQD